MRKMWESSGFIYPGRTGPSPDKALEHERSGIWDFEDLGFQVWRFFKMVLLLGNLARVWDLWCTSIV